MHELAVFTIETATLGQDALIDHQTPRSLLGVGRLQNVRGKHGSSASELLDRIGCQDVDRRNFSGPGFVGGLHKDDCNGWASVELYDS